MKRLEASKKDWLCWLWYYIQRDNMPEHVLFCKQDVVKYYWPRLLEILEREWKYISPEIPENQLFISFPEEDETEI